MKKNNLRKVILIGAFEFILITTVQAGMPLWTFAPVAGYPPAITVSTTETATIKYTVTNQSYRSHALQMQPIQGITASGCNSSLGYYQSCTLSLNVIGNALTGDVTSGPVLCNQGNSLQCYQPSKANSLAIQLMRTSIEPNVSSLALSINCQPTSSCTATQSPALTGNPRQIFFQNTGTASATNVSVSSSGLPSGTSISVNTCNSTLNAGDSCTVILTPGDVANSDASSSACTSGTQPIPGTVTLTADGGISSQVDIYVLGYGCQYQGGFLYSIDDTAPANGSIGGKVASLVDQAAPAIGSGPQATSIIWSSNGSGGNSANVSYDALPGIGETSTPSLSLPTFTTFQSFFSSNYTNTNPFTSSSFSACQGNTDGPCNTSNILTFYNEFITNNESSGTPPPPFTAFSGPTPLTDYAAGLCQQTINGFSDWYLPAICEIDASNNFVTCPTETQSMFGSLSFLLGDPYAGTPSTACSPPSGTDCLVGSYWSSTEYADIPQNFAWYEFVNSAGISGQNAASKGTLLGVRCSRALNF